MFFHSTLLRYQSQFVLHIFSKSFFYYVENCSRYIFILRIESKIQSRAKFLRFLNYVYFALLCIVNSGKLRHNPLLLIIAIVDDA